MFDSYDKPDLEESIKKHLKGELPPIKYKDRLTKEEQEVCKKQADAIISYRIEAPEKDVTIEKPKP